MAFFNCDYEEADNKEIFDTDPEKMVNRYIEFIAEDFMSYIRNQFIESWTDEQDSRDEPIYNFTQEIPDRIKHFYEIKKKTHH